MMDHPTQLSIQVITLMFKLDSGIVDGTMGILSRKMAMPAQLPTNPNIYKDVINIKALDPKKYYIPISFIQAVTKT